MLPRVLVNWHMECWKVNFKKIKTVESLQNLATNAGKHATAGQWGDYLTTLETERDVIGDEMVGDKTLASSPFDKTQSADLVMTERQRGALKYYGTIIESSWQSFTLAEADGTDVDAMTKHFEDWNVYNAYKAEVMEEIIAEHNAKINVPGSRSAYVLSDFPESVANDRDWMCTRPASPILAMGDDWSPVYPTWAIQKYEEPARPVSPLGMMQE